MDEDLTRATLDNLVTQFSSAWDYLRELVQNSIDAGSTCVEVSTQFLAGEGDEGVIEIHVNDYGAGMSEAIIDDQLTQLFSSTKENDLTTIGKFGIGFVSIFALKPKGVLIHTGRAGEYWEVFFHEDLSFTKTRIETPCEGTRVTSYLGGTRVEYADVVEKVRATLSRWCAHSETEISFEDLTGRVRQGIESINLPFEVEGSFARTAERDGLTVAIAYSRQPIYGFFNRGLALAVGADGQEMLSDFAPRFRHIALKIKSPWLEHTLSRETVMRDEHFEQAMRVSAQIASAELRPALVEALCQRVAAGAWDIDERVEYFAWLSFLAREPDSALRDEELEKQLMLRTVEGRAASLKQAFESYDDHDYVFVAPEPTELTRLMRDNDYLVLLGESQAQATQSSAVRGLVGRYVALRHEAAWSTAIRRKLGMSSALTATDVLVDPAAYVFGVRRGVQARGATARLLGWTRELLHESGERYASLELGELSGQSVEPPLVVSGPRLAPVMVGGQHRPRRSLRRRRVAVLDHRHPQMRELSQLVEHSPGLACYCLARAIGLFEDANALADQDLLDLAEKIAGVRA